VSRSSRCLIGLLVFAVFAFLVFRNINPNIAVMTNSNNTPGEPIDSLKESSTTGPSAFYGFSPKLLGKGEFAFQELHGKVVLIVNVASKCGFTGQYQPLQALYDRFQSRGFTILGFPCNQFGMQEPGTDADIQQFCSLNYGVTFPMFSKIDVNGADTAPLFTYLKKEAPGLLGTEAIKWNFTKFLVDRNGKVVGRYAPSTSPEQLVQDIETLLDAPAR
jgi:glutathione peroxidase